MADGAETALGAKADSAYVSGAGSAIAILKGVFARLALGQQNKAASLPVTLATDQGALAVSVADGSDVTLGTTSDAAYTSGAGTLVAILKGIFTRLQDGQQAVGSSLSVVLATSHPTVTTMPVPQRGQSTSRSGTITTGGTAQQLAAANATRSYLLIQNQSSGNLWIDFGTTAVAGQPSILIGPSGSYESPPNFCETGAVSVIGATTGQAWAAKEF